MHLKFNYSTAPAHIRIESKGINLCDYYADGPYEDQTEGICNACISALVDKFNEVMDELYSIKNEVEDTYHRIDMANSELPFTLDRLDDLER